MSAAKKEYQRKLKEEKKKLKEDEKRMKMEMKKGGSAGGRRPLNGSAQAGTASPIKSIGTPFNFQHDTHVGWDSQRGFELRNIPPEWMKLFKDAGATQADLEDPETRRVLVETMQHTLAAPAPPPPPSAPAPPPAPAAPAPPPAPGMGGGGGLGGSSRSVSTAPAAPADPYTPGTVLQAIWSEDGQWYNAKIESSREEGGVKLYLVTFTDYGNQEEVPVESLEPREAPAAPPAAPAKMDMAAQLAAKAGALKSAEDRKFTPKQEESIVDSVQKALAARRAGMCFSVYGHDAVTDESEWNEDNGQDESWMDF